MYFSASIPHPVESVRDSRDGTPAKGHTWSRRRTAGGRGRPRSGSRTRRWRGPWAQRPPPRPRVAGRIGAHRWPPRGRRTRPVGLRRERPDLNDRTVTRADTERKRRESEGIFLGRPAPYFEPRKKEGGNADLTQNTYEVIWASTAYLTPHRFFFGSRLNELQNV